MTFDHAKLITRIADAAHRLSDAASQYACSAEAAAKDREEYDRALVAFGQAHNALELKEKTGRMSASKHTPAGACSPVPPRWWQPDGGSIADVFGLFLPILGFALAALWWAVAE